MNSNEPIYFADDCTVKQLPFVVCMNPRPIYIGTFSNPDWAQLVAEMLNKRREDLRK